MQFNTETVNKILDIDEAYKAPDRLMEILLEPGLREKTFKQFLAISDDLSFDWFHEYFEDEQSARKTKKQDFTPEGIAKLMVQLTDPKSLDYGSRYFEAAAGTGGIMIASWANKPVQYYEVEEMSDKAVPFLLFNMAIRKMHGAVVQCDSLTRKAKDIFITDDGDIERLNHDREVAERYDIREWVTKF